MANTFIVVPGVRGTPHLCTLRKNRTVGVCDFLPLVANFYFEDFFTVQVKGKIVNNYIQC